jgi:regulator of nucleoside diphosphate kinase
MITATSPSTPDIVITEVDFDRLNQLIESPRYRVTHSALFAQLKRELDRGKLVPAPNVPKRVVTMRSRVRVRDLGTDESEIYTLAYPEEANINEGKLSVLAPLGTALLGMRVGQRVEVKVPAGTRRVKVERLLYQPEAAGDLHL